MARLREAVGDARSAAVVAAESGKYRRLAEHYLRQFDRVTVSSTTDAGRLGRQFPGTRFAVVPNGYRASHSIPAPSPPIEGPLRLLFVGTLGYFPNADAVSFLSREVLPALDRIGSREVRVDAIGAGDAAALGDLPLDPRIRVHGFVEDLAPFYASADAAV